MDSGRKERHLVIASGGTGGHFYPAMAIARSFCQGAGRVTLLVGGRHAAEQLRLAQDQGFPARAVPAFRLPNNPIDGVTFPWHFWHTWRFAAHALRDLSPSVVLGMGSFASAPVGLAAATARVPLVLHEGNAVVGRANRFLARWARGMAISLPLDRQRRFRCPCLQTGLPLRESVLAAARDRSLPPNYLDGIGLTPGLPVLLVFGGSQGARYLNQTMASVAGLLQEHAARFQVMHLTGDRDNGWLTQQYQSAGLRCVVKERDERIDQCYLACSLVLCRAGASTISELAIFGRPAILVPLPTAADDHQTANARTTERAGAARLLHQADATPPALAEILTSWLDAPGPWGVIAEKVKTLARPNAAADIVEMICRAEAGLPLIGGQ